MFYPDEYVHVLCGAILHVLEAVHEALKSGQSSKLDFLSLLIGKLALHGHAGMIKSCCDEWPGF